MMYSHLGGLEVTEDDAKGMDVVQSLNEVNSKMTHSALWQMLILLDHCPQTATWVQVT